MIRNFLIAVLSISCIYSCTSNDCEESLIGTYALISEGEFSKAWDTLRVEIHEPKSCSFVIYRRVSYQRKSNGKTLPMETKSEALFATWDTVKRELRETKKGRVYIFPQSNKELLAGKNHYVKIK